MLGVNYKDFDVDRWLDYLSQNDGIKLGLQRIRTVYQELGITNIVKKKIISVSGSNGKGSSCEMLSLILQAQGFSVGVYSSPHIKKFNERISINQNPVSDDDLIYAFNIIKRIKNSICLTFFEIATLTGLIIFKKYQLDFIILEVGIGGRLDAVNVIDADAALMTSVSLDHQDYLGSDLSGIALEKAGIFRPNKPAVCGDRIVYPELIKYCESRAIDLSYAQINYSYNEKGIVYLKDREIYLPENITALGIHQVQNAAGVCELANRIGYFPSDISNVLERFRLPGRMEFIQKRPDIIVDVAHNIDSAKYLAIFLKKNRYRYRKIKMMIGVLSDKDISGILSSVVDISDLFLFVSTYGVRGTKSNKLVECLNKLPMNDLPSYKQFESTFDALKSAYKNLQKDDLLVCFGSFLVVSDVKKNLEKKQFTNDSI